jgi:hypothetical protein
MLWLENRAFLWGSPRWCPRGRLRWDPTNSMHKWITIALMERQNLTYLLQILLSFREGILYLSAIYLIHKILSNSKSPLPNLPSLRFLSTCTTVPYFPCPLRIPATIEYIVLSRGAGKASMWAWSGDDGSILGVLIRAITVKPITVYTEFYDHGPASRSNFSKNLMTWKKGLVLPWKRAYSRGYQPWISLCALRELFHPWFRVWCSIN